MLEEIKIWPLSWDKGRKKSEQQLVTHLDWKFNPSYYHCVQISAYCEPKMLCFWQVQVNHFSRLSRDVNSSFSTGYGKELFLASIEVIGGICSWWMICVILYNFLTSVNFRNLDLRETKISKGIPKQFSVIWDDFEVTELTIIHDTCKIWTQKLVQGTKMLIEGKFVELRTETVFAEIGFFVDTFWP